MRTTKRERHTARWLAWLVVGLAAVAGAVLSAGTASAHASLVSTSPAPGQRFDRPPTEIVLDFSERVRPLRDGVRLVDPQGRAVDHEQAANPPGHPGRIRLSLPADLRDGAYTVSWRVVSADSHPINGAFVFTVGAGSAAAQPDGALAGTDVAGPVVAGLWLARVAGYASLALFLGGTVFLMVCWPAGMAHRRARRILLIGAGGVFATAALALLLQGPYAAGRSLAGMADPRLLADTLRTDYGLFITARIAILAMLALTLTRLLRPPVFGAFPRGPRSAETNVTSAPNRACRLAALVVLGIALPATWVGTGHANARPLVQGVANTAHLVAMSVWVGGLVMLAACVLPIKRGGVALPEAATAVTRFSRMAMIAVAVLVGTGLVQAWLELGGLAALTGSGYGRLLFAKLAAVGLVLWLGAMSRAMVQRRWLRPATVATRPKRADRERERVAFTQLLRSVRFEAAIVAVVLGVTAALVATPPGTHGHATAASLATATQTGPVVRDVQLSGVGRALVRVEPARAGPNRISVSVLDSAGAARDVPEVTATLRLAAADLGPFDVTFDRLAAGNFRSTEVTMPIGGSWQVELAVRTSDFDQSKAAAEVPIP